MNKKIINNTFLRYLNSKVPPPFRRNYSYYKKASNLLNENLSKQSIKEIQLRQLNKILEISWQIPGYRNFWKSHNFNKKQLSHLKEYLEIPPIDKEYIRTNRNNFLPLTNSYAITKTGGSTGNPFQCYDPLYMSRIEQAFILHAWRQHYSEIGITTKSTILRGAKVKKNWAYDPMRGLILSSFRLKEEIVLEFVKLIDRYKTPVLHAYPSSLYQFSKYLKKLNCTPKHKFKLIALGSEPLAEYQKNLFKEVFNAPISHWYGHGEKVIFAANKPNTSHHYVEKLYGITELLSSEAYQTPIGEEGELVGTSLWNNCMPLIRYRTGDRAVSSKIWDDEINQPGVLSKIIGRKHEYLVTKKGALLTVTAHTLLYGIFDEIKRVRFEQDTIGTATLHVELMDKNKPFDQSQLGSMFTELMGDDIDIKINIIEEIKPTKTGKHIYINQKLDLTEFQNGNQD